MTSGAVRAEPLADEHAAAAWLDVERANLVAVATSTDPRLRSYSWQFADVLRGYFARRGHGPDGLAICTAALEAAMLAGDTRAGRGAWRTRRDPLQPEQLRGRDHPPRAGTGDQPPHWRRPRRSHGVTALSLGNTDETLHRSLKALRLGLAIGDADVEIRALHALGVESWAKGDLTQARMFLTRCRKRCEDTGDLLGLAASFVSLAETACDAGDYGDAAARARVALELGSELGERRHEISGLELLGTASLGTGDIEAATRHYTEALQRARAIGFGYGQTSILLGLAAASRVTGLPADAVARSREALGILAASGMR